jgi:hypothetical protein
LGPAIAADVLEASAPTPVDAGDGFTHQQVFFLA